MKLRESTINLHGRFISRSFSQPSPPTLLPYLISRSPHLLLTSLPQENKQLLGNQLFGLINPVQPRLAGKITGMLLEAMDDGENIRLLVSPEALNVKIEEAIEVLAPQPSETSEGEACMQSLETTTGIKQVCSSPHARFSPSCTQSPEDLTLVAL